MVFGNSGAGKSSTINSIFEGCSCCNEVAKVGETGESCTKHIQTINGHLFGRKVTIFDTPGFFDT